MDCEWGTTLKVYVLSAIFAAAFSGCSFAQGVPDDIMINTLRCEAGKIGKKLQQAKLPLNQVMAVTWKDSRTNNGGFGGGFKFPFFDFGLSGELSREDLAEASSDGLTFNLHPDNLAVCTGYKKRIVKEGVGAYPCLGEQKYPSLSYALSRKAGSTGCHYKVSLVKKLSGSLKVPLWGLEVGPSGSYGDTTGYDMVVAAPPKKGG
jgi:hypothetical protein